MHASSSIPQIVNHLQALAQFKIGDKPVISRSEQCLKIEDRTFLVGARRYSGQAFQPSYIRQFLEETWKKLDEAYYYPSNHTFKADIIRDVEPVKAAVEPALLGLRNLSITYSNEGKHRVSNELTDMHTTYSEKFKDLFDEAEKKKAETVESTPVQQEEDRPSSPLNPPEKEEIPSPAPDSIPKSESPGIIRMESQRNPVYVQQEEPAQWNRLLRNFLRIFCITPEEESRAQEDSTDLVTAPPSQISFGCIPVTEKPKSD